MKFNRSGNFAYKQRSIIQHVLSSCRSFSVESTQHFPLQWRHGRGHGVLAPNPVYFIAPPLNCNLSNIFFQKYKILGYKFPILGNLGTKLNLCAPIITFVGNLQLSVGKFLLLLYPPTFSTHDAAVRLGTMRPLVRSNKQFSVQQAQPRVNNNNNNNNNNTRFI